MTSESTTAAPIVTDGAQPVVASPIVDPSSSSATSGNLPAEPVAPVVDPAPVIEPVVEADPGAEAASNANKATPEWAQKRINELTAKRYEAERSAAQDREAREIAEARTADLLKQLSGGNAADPAAPNTAPVAGPSKEEIDRQVQVRAAELTRVNEFNKTCNNIAEVGKKEFKDWDEALKNLGLVGAVGANANPEFLETAVELKSPHAVLHYLGTNLEEAERLVNLSPKKMALEMARLEAALSAPAPAPIAPPVSKAPAPVIPVGGKATAPATNIDDPDLSTDDFMALRAKQVDERRKRYQR